MAFYRVTIWLENGEIHQGIRELDNSNIDFATNVFRSKAAEHYRNLKDVEAAMLSNHSTAVKQFMAKRERQKEAKKWPKPSQNTTDYNRKKEPSHISLEERMKLKKP